MQEILPHPHPLFIKFLKERWGENILLADYTVEIHIGLNYGLYDKKENPKGMKIIKEIKNNKLILE